MSKYSLLLFSVSSGLRYTIYHIDAKSICQMIEAESQVQGQISTHVAGGPHFHSVHRTTVIDICLYV